MKKKTVIITGANSGLGCEIVERFSGKNFNLVLHFCEDTSKKDKLEAGLKKKYPNDRRLWICGSFDNIDFINEFYHRAYSLFKNIHILINNAGLTINKPIIKLDDDELNRVLNINLNSVKNLSKLVLKNMIKNKEGYIINISSYQALTGGAHISPYCSSKAALIALTKAIALEYGEYNIHANIILPGYMETKMTNMNSEVFKEKVRDENCLKRLNDPLEVSTFIYFLTKMNNISGQVFNLDSRILPQ